MKPWKFIGPFIVFVAALAVAVPFTVGTIKQVVGVPALAAKVEMVSERLEQKIIQDRMDKLQERMWSMEDRWGEKFMVEKNRIHDTLDELLHFMTPEARDHYRRLWKEYEELEAELREDDE